MVCSSGEQRLHAASSTTTLSYLTPWATLYAHKPTPVPELVRAYDRSWWRLRLEVQETRTQLLQLQARLEEVTTGIGDEGARRVGKLSDEREQLRKEVLRLRDLVVGKDAELATALGRVEEMTAMLQRYGNLEVRLNDVLQSNSWRLSQAGRPPPPQAARAEALMSPRFSIVTPVYDTPAAVLRSTIRSVTEQTFPDWELCLIDDCSPSPDVAEVLDRSRRRRAPHQARPASGERRHRRRVQRRPRRRHRRVRRPARPRRRAAPATRSRLVDEALRAQPDADYVYSDEDKIDEHGRRSGPFYKPDWSPERLRTQMYTCHLSVLRRIARRRGRRVPCRRTRARRTGTSCCGSPSGRARSSTSRRCSTTGACSPVVHRGRRRGRQAVRLRGRHAGPAGPLRAHRAAGHRRA